MRFAELSMGKQMIRHLHIIGLTLGLLLVTTAWGETWSVLTADFAHINGELQNMDAGGVGILPAGGTARRLEWKEVIWVEKNAPRSSANKGFILIGRDGRKLVGTPGKIANDKMVMTGDLLGEIAVPMDQVKGLARGGGALPEAVGTEDLVMLTNRDELRGIVGEADAAGIVLQQGGNSTTVAWDNVKAIVLANVAGTDVKGGGLRLTFADGSLWPVESLSVSSGQAKLILAGQAEVNVPVDNIVAIANAAGRVSWLAMLKPMDARYTPYTRFTDQPAKAWELLDDWKSAEGICHNVIALRPNSLLKYAAPVDGQFHMRYACDKPGSLTNMTLSVTVGDKKVFEQKNIREAAPAAAVDIPVRQGEAVAIRVDYGTNLDAQDRLLLIDAGFVRSEAQPRPVTEIAPTSRPESK